MTYSFETLYSEKGATPAFASFREQSRAESVVRDKTYPVVYFMVNILDIYANFRGAQPASRFQRKFDLLIASLNKYGRSLEDSYGIYIGTTDMFTPHDGAYTSLNYRDLYQILAYYGYDPLYIIRTDEGYSRFQRRFDNKIRNLLTNVQYITTNKITSALTSVAKDVVDEIRAYINSGNKPFLNPNTINRRTYTKDHHPNYYRGATGINEPLSETGLLEKSINFYIRSWRSAAVDRLFMDVKEAERQYKRFERKFPEFSEDEQMAKIPRTKKNIWPESIPQRAKPEPPAEGGFAKLLQAIQKESAISHQMRSKLLNVVQNNTVEDTLRKIDANIQRAKELKMDAAMMELQYARRIISGFGRQI